MKSYTQQDIEKRIENSEYWANKNGYEQEAVRELLEVVKMLVNELYKSRDSQDEGK